MSEEQMQAIISLIDLWSYDMPLYDKEIIEEEFPELADKLNKLSETIANDI